MIKGKYRMQTPESMLHPFISSELKNNSFVTHLITEEVKNKP